MHCKKVVRHVRAHHMAFAAASSVVCPDAVALSNLASLQLRHLATGQVINLRKEGNVWMLDLWVPVPEGFPRPEIQWLKDGHVMSSERRRFDIRPDGSLVVQNVTQEDEGMYECVADNGHERKSAQARFSVRSAREISNAFTYTSVDDADPGSTIGDQFVLVALEEALVDVDKALNSTLDHLFSASNRGGNATSSSRELLRIFRYPPENQRGVARAAEVFERTLDLVAEKVKSIDDHSSRSFSNFTYQDLVSPYNLELIGNLSGKRIS